MTELIDNLGAIGNCVFAAHMSTACDRWHLEERAVPSLMAMADHTEEPRLHQAAEATAEAGKHLMAAQQALRSAARLIEECATTPEPA